VAIINVLASVAVKDLNAAIKWYEAIFRRSPSRPMPEVAEWSFERGGWLQVYQLPERAGSGSFTLVVSNLDDEVERLKRLNIDTGNRTSTAKVKTLMITDPEGNHVAFAEPTDPSLAK
jgi:predicted enzyme related to lactoylglutathione lyase